MLSSGKRLEILSFDIDYFLFYSADADIGKNVPWKIHHLVIFLLS